MVYVERGALADDAILRSWVQRGVTYVGAHPAKSKRRARA